MHAVSCVAYSCFIYRRAVLLSHLKNGQNFCRFTSQWWETTHSGHTDIQIGPSQNSKVLWGWKRLRDEMLSPFQPYQIPQSTQQVIFFAMLWITVQLAFYCILIHALFWLFSLLRIWRRRCLPCRRKPSRKIVQPWNSSLKHVWPTRHARCKRFWNWRSLEPLPQAPAD